MFSIFLTASTVLVPAFISYPPAFISAKPHFCHFAEEHLSSDLGHSKEKYSQFNSGFTEG